MGDIVRSIIEHLSASTAVSRHVQALLVTAYVLIGAPYNAARLGGSLAFWVVAMLAGQILVAASLGSLGPIHQRLPRTSWRVVFALLTYAAWGTVSAVLMGMVGVATGLAEDHILGERLTVGVLFALPIATTAAVAFGVHRRHRDLVGTLVAELDRLQAGLEAAEREIVATRAELHRSVTTDLLPRLAVLRSRVVDRAAAVTVYGEVASDVRALAHRLAEEARPWDPPVRPDRKPERALGVLADAATLVRPVSPGVMTGVLVFLGMVWTARIVGLEEASRMLLAAPWTYLVLRGGAALMRSLRARPFLLRATVLTVTFVVASSWGGLAGTTPELRVLFTWAILLVGVGLGWTTALGHAWDERRQVLLRELTAAVTSLDHGVARTNQRLRLERERLARIVHGPVQDRLVAAGERLLAAPVEGEAAIRHASELIDEAERLIAGPEVTPVELAPLLDGIATVWGGLATMTYRIDERVAEALRYDDAAAETAAEIIREGVSNAVRHGRSKRIEVLVTARGTDAFVVEVVGDGCATAERTRVGLGTRFLEASTLEWRLERGVESGSRLRAVIPWAASAHPAARGLWRP